MGNVASHLHDSSRNSIPPHLRPVRRTRTLKKRLAAEKAQREQQVNEKADREREKRERKGFVKEASTISSDNDYEELPSFELRSNFKWIKGRRFHDVKGSRYLLPNDSAELERLRMQSYIFKWAFSRNYVAPLDELLARGAKVLDLGCGPGVWVIDMANDFPASEFIGLDMCDIWPKPCSPNSPIQRHFPAFRPTTSRPTSPEMMKSPVDALVQNSNRKITSPSPSSCPSPKLDLEATTDNNQPSTSIATSADTDFELPPNLFFKQANILDGLPYENDQFDFVHQRCFQYAYTRRQWTNVLDDIVRVVKPGGWVQLMEVDPKGKRLGPRSDALLLKMTHAIRARDIEPDVAESLKDLLSSAGLVDVETSMVSVPAGDWGFELGYLWRKNLHEFIQGLKPWLTRSFGMTGKEYDQSWAQVSEEFEQYQSFFNVHVAWGRKPESGVIQTHWETCEYVRRPRILDALRSALLLDTAAETGDNGQSVPLFGPEVWESLSEDGVAKGDTGASETKEGSDPKVAPKSKFKKWQEKIIEKYIVHGLGLKEGQR